jgi:hypothetical protein
MTSRLAPVSRAVGAATIGAKVGLARRESSIENAIADYARNRKLLSVKLNVMGSVGWPDRAYFFRGRTLFIEFKRPGEKLRPAQEYIIEKLEIAGFEVHVIDNVPQAIQVIDTFMSKL